jgi:hypothetical protein
MPQDQSVQLQDISKDGNREYYCRQNKKKCVIVGGHRDDGACLIAEALDEEDNDLTNELFYTESSFLTPL